MSKSTNSRAATAPRKRPRAPSRRLVTACGLVLACVVSSACASSAPKRASELPPRCTPLEEWAHGEAVDNARLLAAAEAEKVLMQAELSGGALHTAADHDQALAEWYRLDREDWLEAYCLSINAFREAASER